ncbi:MAG: four helix bundle protein [Candidatus Abawacabacteria bacterium RBG_16_42_10]|uniref:Four helix bundle protein n=1 Tax=Candidatus Abawacabacteria bacterium RBG_16_42_10 TaxID=1817814 RepID=A0A1F4XLL6_9BACT|nr:MAG: four helix bundle protein [Candidatus Abawacabacteria bacterium RBG_16_42_10]
MKKVIIREKSFDFALQIIKLSKSLIENHEFVLSNQILKSGTSIGANVEESQSAESTRDFIHKLNISLKEAKETRYWLLLFKKGKVLDLDYEPYLANVDEIIRILVKIIKTSSGLV